MTRLALGVLIWSVVHFILRSRSGFEENLD